MHKKQALPTSQPTDQPAVQLNTCAICCPPRGMEFWGVDDATEAGGNRGRTMRVIEDIIFEDRGTTDK